MNYKVGIIGCGKRGLKHVPGLLADKRCEIACAADLNLEAATAMSKKFNSNPAVYTEPDWQGPEMKYCEEETMIDMVRDIVDSMENNIEADADYRKALRAAEIIFALYESVRQNAKVELPVKIRDNPFLTMLEAGAFGK